MRGGRFWTQSRRLNSANPRWLFPGQVPGRPPAPSSFTRKFRKHGVDVLPGRHAALVALLEDVPPPILADTLGLHINTVVRWADIARRDWTAYLAARDGEPRPPGSKSTPDDRMR